MKFYDKNGKTHNSIRESFFSNIKAMTHQSKYEEELDDDSYYFDEEDPKPKFGEAKQIIINTDKNRLELLNENGDIIAESIISDKLCQGLTERIINDAVDELSLDLSHIDNVYMEKCLESCEKEAIRIASAFKDKNISFNDMSDIIDVMSKEITSVIRQVMVSNPTCIDSNGKNISDDIVKSFLDNVITTFIKNNLQ